MMGCGLGVCWTCAVPVVARDGERWWNVRACVEGPVFNAARIWWDRWLPAPPPVPRPEEAQEDSSGEGGPDADVDGRDRVEASPR
jgi:dihydroorotate dehydrogenase electron transfer subunit